MVGVGKKKKEGEEGRKNTEAIYYNENDTIKNGYKYLLGVGGYTGREIGSAKSVQEVFADIDSNMKVLPTDGVVSNEEIDELFK